MLNSLVKIFSLITTVIATVIANFEGCRVHTIIKITNNTKMNCIMVSFWDLYNFIFIDRVPYKHKNWQFHSILITDSQTTYFLLICTKLLFQLKMWKITSHPEAASWNIQNPALKNFKRLTKTTIFSWKFNHPTLLLKTVLYMRILKSLALCRN